MSNPALGGFIGIGEALAQKVGDFFQPGPGTSTPNSRPVSSPGFSFNFGEAFKNLTQPVADLFNPVTQAKNKTIGAAGSAASDLIKAAGGFAGGLITKAEQRLEDALFNNNTKPTVNTSLIPTVQNPQPSGFADSLAALLPLLTGSGNVNATTRTATDEQIVQAAARNSQNNVLLIGGALVLGAFILASKKGR